MNVAPGTCQRVMQVIEELNFEPDPSARRLANKKTGTIALVFQDIIGINTGLTHSQDNKGWLQGYQKNLRDAATSIQQHRIVPDNFNDEAGQVAIHKLLESTSPLATVLATTRHNLCQKDIFLTMYVKAYIDKSIGRRCPGRSERRCAEKQVASSAHCSIESLMLRRLATEITEPFEFFLCFSLCSRWQKRVLRKVS